MGGSLGQRRRASSAAHPRRLTHVSGCIARRVGGVTQETPLHKRGVLHPGPRAARTRAGVRAHRRPARRRGQPHRRDARPPLRDLARHGATMAIFTAGTRGEDLQCELVRCGYRRRRAARSPTRSRATARSSSDAGSTSLRRRSLTPELDRYTLVLVGAALERRVRGRCGALTADASSDEPFRAPHRTGCRATQDEARPLTSSW